MGYDIRPITELETFDYSLCSGFSTKDTVRKSIDGQFFIVEGETFTTYTQQEMLAICEGANWNEQEDI
jgi:hypothetical protein